LEPFVEGGRQVRIGVGVKERGKRGKSTLGDFGSARGANNNENSAGSQAPFHGCVLLKRRARR